MNTGKTIAKDCSISARYTGLDDKPFRHIPLSKRMFPLYWIDENEQKRIIDLYPTEFSVGYVELPLKAYVGLDGMSFGITSDIKKDYDEGYSFEEIFTDDDKGNRYYHIQVIFYIRYNSEMKERRYLIKIKTLPAPITKDDVTFTSLGTR